MVDHSVCNRYFAPNLYAITCYTVNEESIFDSDAKNHLLQSVLKRIEARGWLRLPAYLFLPDQLHLLVALGSKRTIDEVVQHIKTEYSHEYATLMGNPEKMLLFEQQHRIRRLVDQEDFAACLDQLHRMPVELGLVSRPEEWPYSSYERWVERQLYRLGWGWEKPRPQATPPNAKK